LNLHQANKPDILSLGLLPAAACPHSFIENSPRRTTLLISTCPGKQTN
jgi:hypothetical protein